MLGQIHRLGAFQHLLIGHTCATRLPPLRLLLFSLYTSTGGRGDPVWGVYKGSGVWAIGRSAAAAACGDGSTAREQCGRAERRIYTLTYRHSHPFQPLPCPTWHASHARAGSTSPSDPAPGPCLASLAFW